MKFKHRIRLLAVMTVAIVAFGIAVPTVEALRAMRGDVVDIQHTLMLSLGVGLVMILALGAGSWVLVGSVYRSLGGEPEVAVATVRSIMQMDEFTRRNAAMAQQTATVAGSMTSQAKALTDLIAVFTVQDKIVPLQVERAAPVVAKPPAIAPKIQPVAVDEPIAVKKVAGSDLEWQEF